MPWIFDYCTDCAKAEAEGHGDSTNRWDSGVGCSAEGPCDGCAAVWIWRSPEPAKGIDLRTLGFVYRVSDEALAEIKANDRRAAQVLQTAHLYWFGG